MRSGGKSPCRLHNESVRIAAPTKDPRFAIFSFLLAFAAGTYSVNVNISWTLLPALLVLMRPMIAEVALRAADVGSDQLLRPDASTTLLATATGRLPATASPHAL